MNRETYRAHPALNFSSAKYLLDSPADYQAHIAAPRIESAALTLGTLAHSVILEDAKLEEVAAIKPDRMSFVTKDGKAWRAEQTLPIISEAEAQDIAAMREAVFANPYAKRLLELCQERETPLLGKFRGVQIKGLLDASGLNKEAIPIIVDLKTTQDPSPRAFAKSVEFLHYDMQAEWYASLYAEHLQVEDEPVCYWIAVKKTAPYTAVVHTLSEPRRMIGRDKMDRAIELYKRCTESGTWPHPYQEINVIE